MKNQSRRLSELMARWVVLEVNEDKETVLVEDVDDAEEVRIFKLEDVERVAGGETKVTGHEFVYEPDFTQAETDTFEDDPFDDGDQEEVSEEPGSLFDDPRSADEDEVS